MSDPEVEAARRASQNIETPIVVFKVMLDAAREALAPIRELHKRWNHWLGPVCAECDEGTAPWPCDTARLCYTDEELNR